MVSTTIARATGATTPRAARFGRLASLCALLTGAAGFVHTAAFVVAPAWSVWLGGTPPRARRG
jgi:hypothetical protein